MKAVKSVRGGEAEGCAAAGCEAGSPVLGALAEDCAAAGLEAVGTVRRAEDKGRSAAITGRGGG